VWSRQRRHGRRQDWQTQAMLSWVAALMAKQVRLGCHLSRKRALPLSAACCVHAPERDGGGAGNSSALVAAPSAASNSPVAAPAEEAGDAGVRVHFEGAESWDFNVLLLSKDCA
jgi:hypothetical protein